MGKLRAPRIDIGKEAKRWEEEVEAAQKRLGMPIPEKGSPYERPGAVLRRESYELIRSFLLEGLDVVIKYVVRNDIKIDKRRSPKLDFDLNPYYWGLWAFDSESEYFDDKLRSRIAKELHYASLHNVPVEHLIGFLYQCGGPAMISRKLKARSREDWAP